MIGWMLYATTVSLLLSGAAALIAPALRRHRIARLAWFGAIAASLLLPAAMSSVSIEIPNLQNGTAPARLALRNLPPALVTPSQWAAALPAQILSAPSDRALGRAWLALSVLLAALALTATAGLTWRRRRWSRAEILGTPVLVAPDAGPALVGVFRPEIVVPRWLLAAPAETQRHVLAHEQSHRAARDPWLLAAAIASLIATPWNLPLWWLAGRLRFAIETDCDARLLGAGIAPSRYAETLIGVGERRRSGTFGALAMAQTASQLERRIRLMLPATEKHRWHRPALGAACLALATAVAPPNAGADTPSPEREAAFRKLVDSFIAKHPDYADMTPQLANTVRGAPQIAEALASLGPVQSITYLGRGNAGEDVYTVHQEKGATHWHFSYADGKINGALVTMGP